MSGRTAFEDLRGLNGLGRICITERALVLARVLSNKPVKLAQHQHLSPMWDPLNQTRRGLHENTYQRKTHSEKRTHGHARTLTYLYVHTHITSYMFTTDLFPPKSFSASENDKKVLVRQANMVSTSINIKSSLITSPHHPVWEDTGLHSCSWCMASHLLLSH